MKAIALEKLELFGGVEKGEVLNLSPRQFTELLGAELIKEATDKQVEAHNKKLGRVKSEDADKGDGKPEGADAPKGDDNNSTEEGK